MIALYMAMIMIMYCICPVLRKNVTKFVQRDDFWQENFFFKMYITNMFLYFLNVNTKIIGFLPHQSVQLSANLYLQYVNYCHPCTKNNKNIFYLSLTSLFSNNCTENLNPNVFNKILVLSVMF